MRCSRRLRFLIVSFLVLASGCASLWEKHPPATLKTVHFTVLHTNDNHGKFWRNRRGEAGMAARKTLVDRVRAEVKEQGGYVLVLSAGDINTGVPESDIQEARPDFIGMNLIGYDAMSIGNHEFDNPLEVLRNRSNGLISPFCLPIRSIRIAAGDCSVPR